MSEASKSSKTTNQLETTWVRYACVQRQVQVQSSTAFLCYLNEALRKQEINKNRSTSLEATFS